MLCFDDKHWVHWLHFVSSILNWSSDLLSSSSARECKISSLLPSVYRIDSVTQLGSIEHSVSANCVSLVWVNMSNWWKEDITECQPNVYFLDHMIRSEPNDATKVFIRPTHLRMVIIFFFLFTGFLLARWLLFHSQAIVPTNHDSGNTASLTCIANLHFHIVKPLFHGDTVVMLLSPKKFTLKKSWHLLSYKSRYGGFCDVNFTLTKVIKECRWGARMMMWSSHFNCARMIFTVIKIEVSFTTIFCCHIRSDSVTWQQAVDFFLSFSLCP